MTTRMTLSDTEMLDGWADLARTKAEVERQMGLLEFELQQRMEEREARAILWEHGTCELKMPTPTIDPSRLVALREILPPEVIAEGFILAHEKTITVPESWDMRKVNTWVKFGYEVAKIIEAAKLPGRGRLKITPKEE